MSAYSAGSRTTAATITRLQNVQKRNHPDSALWQSASRELNSLYEKVATLAPELQREIAEQVPGMFLPSKRNGGAR